MLENQLNFSFQLERVTALFLAFLLSVTAASAFAKDTDDDSLFVRPSHIAEAVDFWSRVYSEVDTQSGYIHDNRHPRIVYEMMPLDRGDSPRQQQHDIDKRVSLYKSLLSDMAGRPESEYSLEQRRIAELWGNLDEESVREAAKRVRFQRGQSERFLAGMQRQKSIGPKVNAVLQKHGLPMELAALPQFESSYNPKVKSHAGALGLWQIMPATGKRYIKVNAQVDERLNIGKATEAAARLLKHNYSVLGDWSLAVTAYNRGLAGVRRAVREAGTADIGEISAGYEGRGFGFASRNFYAAFLAAHDVSSGAHREVSGAGASIQLERYLAAHLLAEEFDVSLLALKDANPQLDIRYWNGEKLLPGNHAFRLPTGDFEISAIRSLEALYGSDEQHADRYYRIQRGDKLALLARDLELDMTHLMELNGVRSVHRIYAGQILQLPNATLASANLAMGPSKQAASPMAAFANLQTDVPPPQEMDSRLASRAAPVSEMVYGVMRDDVAIADAARYAYESMRLSTPSAWDVRLAASIPALAVIPDSLQRDAQADFMLAEVGAGEAALQADPADYLVAANGSIEIQVGETIGHYAHWLGVSSKQLRLTNKLRKRQHVVIGRRLQLDFSATDRATFEWRRREYHESQQAQYFSNYQITGVQQHALRGGDNLWELATSEYIIPLWLLRQYNPDLDFATVLPLNSQLNIPVVTAKS